MGYEFSEASKRVASFLARRSPRAGQTSSSFLYLISEGPEGPVKIGRSRNPGARLCELQTGNARKLRLVARYELTHDDACDAERQLHEELAEWALSGEWFQLDEIFMIGYVPDFFLAIGMEPTNGSN